MQPQNTQPASNTPNNLGQAGINPNTEAKPFIDPPKVDKVNPKRQQQMPNDKQTGKGDGPITTQSTLLISELRDSTVIMKDGSFRAVIACKPVNFDLMSESERAGVEYSYQGFLNSLNYNIQILVRSQKVDITPYVDRLSSIRRSSDNMLLNILMDDYIDFIKEISQYANIMDKSFFVVIPYYTSGDGEKVMEQTKNFFASFNTKASEPKVTRISRDVYEKAISDLADRVNAVMNGLQQVGVKCVRLNTKELGELYYNFNNPDTAIRQPLGDFHDTAQLYVQKGAEGNQPLPPEQQNTQPPVQTTPPQSPPTNQTQPSAQQPSSFQAQGNQGEFQSAAFQPQTNQPGSQSTPFQPYQTNGTSPFVQPNNQSQDLTQPFNQNPFQGGANV